VSDAFFSVMPQITHESSQQCYAFPAEKTPHCLKKWKQMHWTFSTRDVCRK